MQKVRNIPVSLPLPLDGADNVRDLGGYPTLHGKATKTGVLYRGDSLHRLTPQSEALLARKGIATVIDLRTAAQREKWPGRCSAPTILHIPIEDTVPGANGPRPADTIEELYLSILEHQKPALCRAFEAIAGAKAPLLFHCVLGKDRTGLIAALLLSLAGAPDEAVIADYAASEHNMAKTLLNHKLRDAFSGLHPDDSLYRSRPETMATVLEYLEITYGGAKAYLATLGLSEATITALRSLLLG